MSRNRWLKEKVEAGLHLFNTGASDWEEALGQAMVELNIAGVNDRYGQGEAKTFRDLLNGRLYRAKYRIPRTQALSAREITARRKQIAQEKRPWENAPTYRRAHERDGKAPPEPEAQAPREATQAPTAEAPVPPKRERESAPKKTSGKKNTQG